MDVSFNVIVSSYVVRKTRDFSSTPKCYGAISVIANKKCHVNLFNDCTATIYLNAQCQQKEH